MVCTRCINKFLKATVRIRDEVGMEPDLLVVVIHLLIRAMRLLVGPAELQDPHHQLLDLDRVGACFVPISAMDCHGAKKDILEVGEIRFQQELDELLRESLYGRLRTVSEFFNHRSTPCVVASV